MLPVARVATLAGFLVIAAIEVFGAVDRTHAGLPAATLAPETSTSDRRFVVTHVRAGSRLHLGDHVEIDDPSLLAAVQFHALAAGSTLRVRRISPPPEVTIDEPVIANMASTLIFVLVVIQAMFLGLAAVVAARGRSSGSLQLAWLFALLVLLFNPTGPSWPHGLILAYEILDGATAVAAFWCAGDFASRFLGDPEAAWARRFRRLSLGLAVVACGVSLGVSVQSVTATATPLVLQDAVFAALLAQTVLLLVGLAIAFRKAPEGERQKALWVAASLGVGIVGLVSAIVAEFAGIKEPLRDLPLLLLAAMPVGCAYAILRYRLLDIAFIINRATVFGITSLLVLAGLALVDYGLQNLLGSWLLRTGLYVQLGLALAIGIATRPLHGRVDAFVDDLFFRERHRAERDLRQFAHDVAYIDDASVVLERTAETVARAAELRCSLFLLQADGGFRSAPKRAPFEDAIERNDAAIVRMLATRTHVDLHDVPTAIAGDFAFPMFARDRLLGILVCGDKTAAVAAYAPDELDAISVVARAAGFALDLLRIEALERELETLRASARGASAIVTP